MADSITRRRLRSGTVVLGGVGLLAAALTACDSDPDKRCVDRDSYTTGKGYKVVDDKYCKSTKSSAGNTGWYYGGSKSGSRIKSGSFTKSSGGSGGGSGVSRGGFGGKGGSGG
ncbi:hypothetical protein ACN2WE_25145 [Streptomyces sp. cg28]|uniref:hypothetical protein n=1 Tax=unclassified Streptomyces TaxID=2593676 RepID=UPI000DBA72BE|nr:MULTISPECIES: hypothetical protein [unclassified Streptomyces]MYT68650.1 hypothetical protein [Streptomyces sp. SID8367]RAJ86321.1 hypothetical protein K377_03168 [Streptomyces sp. PsTaAH-137]